MLYSITAAFGSMCVCVCARAENGVPNKVHIPIENKYPAQDERASTTIVSPSVAEQMGPLDGEQGETNERRHTD